MIFPLVQSYQCLTTNVFHYQDGDSTLMLAATWGRTEVVSLLLEAEANTDLQNKVKCRCDLGIQSYQCLTTHVFHHTEWILCTDDGCQGG